MQQAGRETGCPLDEMMADRIEMRGIKTFKSELIGRRWLSKRTFEIELSRGADFRFRPGQRIRLIYKDRERDYSPASGPDDPIISLCIREVKGGEISPILADCTIGTIFRIQGPFGYFFYRTAARPALFVATGTGIAPFVSMVRSGTVGSPLLHGVQHSRELYYEPILRPLLKEYIPCFSRAPQRECERHGAFQGRVTEYLKHQLPPMVYDFYLCGRSEMIRDVTHLIDDRFPNSRVYTEQFY